MYWCFISNKFSMSICNLTYFVLVIFIISLNLSTFIFGCPSNLYWTTGLDKRVNWHWVSSTSGRHTIGHICISRCATEQLISCNNIRHKAKYQHNVRMAKSHEITEWHNSMCSTANWTLLACQTIQTNLVRYTRAFDTFEFFNFWISCFGVTIPFISQQKCWLLPRK